MARRRADRAEGALALVGGGEWRDACRGLDASLLERSAADAVVVLPTAAAYEQPDRVVERAVAWFGALGARVVPVMALHRAEAEDASHASVVASARFVYLADGSPLHLRSVLKDSALLEALVAAWRAGAVVAASGAGASVLCDPMVDPRGGAYTVGLGVVGDLAVFPYHGSTAEHLWERSVDLLPRAATLVGIDEETAVVRDAPGRWHVVGPGRVTVCSKGAEPRVLREGDAVDLGGR